MNSELNLSKEIDDLKQKNHELEKRTIYLESCIENLDFSPKVQCPICGGEHLAFLPYGVNIRKNALCPNCFSLERHRFIYYFLKEKTDFFNKNIKILHFAPEQVFFNLFEGLSNFDYITADIENKENIKEVIDMTNITYPENTFDTILNFHVLEHIQDDLKAMSELYRVVKPSNEGGFVLISVPLKADITYENDQYNTPELRLKYFGHKEHVRNYGFDIESRLKSVGFKVTLFKPSDILNADEIKKYGIKNDYLYYCEK